MFDKLIDWVARPRVAYYADNFIWFWLALAAVLSAIGFLFDPTGSVASTPISRVLTPYTYLWELGFGVGGAQILYGLIRRRPDWEAFGQIVLGGAVVIYWLAVLSVGQTALAVFVYPALFISSFLRAAALVGRARIAEQRRKQEEPHGLGKSGTLLSIAPMFALVGVASGIDPTFQVIAVLLAIVLGSGGYAAFKKIRPEVNNLGTQMAENISSAADRIIQRQASELERQAKEIAELRDRISSLETSVLHQQTTDRDLAICRAGREAYEQAVLRLNHRVEELIDFMGKSGIRLPSEANHAGEPE